MGVRRPGQGPLQRTFVSGTDQMINRVTEQIPNAKTGFRLLFSPAPFPGFAIKLEWRRSEYGGNWYFCPQLDMEGWLCAALFKYFTAAPRELYAKVEALEE